MPKHSASPTIHQGPADEAAEEVTEALGATTADTTSRLLIIIITGEEAEAMETTTTGILTQERSSVLAAEATREEEVATIRQRSMRKIPSTRTTLRRTKHTSRPMCNRVELTQEGERFLGLQCAGHVGVTSEQIPP